MFDKVAYLNEAILAGPIYESFAVEANVNYIHFCAHHSK